MRKLILLTFFSSIYVCGMSQHYWTQVKTTSCKAHGIEPSLQVGSKVTKVTFAYEWQKTKCDEATMQNTIKVPKLKKGYHLTPDGKHYYNTGQFVYQIIGNSCGAKTWKPSEFWVMMQKK